MTLTSLFMRKGDKKAETKKVEDQIQNKTEFNEYQNWMKDTKIVQSK